MARRPPKNPRNRGYNPMSQMTEAQKTAHRKEATERANRENALKSQTAKEAKERKINKRIEQHLTKADFFQKTMKEQGLKANNLQDLRMAFSQYVHHVEGNPVGSGDKELKNNTLRMIANAPLKALQQARRELLNSKGEFTLHASYANAPGSTLRRTIMDGMSANQKLQERIAQFNKWYGGETVKMLNKYSEGLTKEEKLAFFNAFAGAEHGSVYGTPKDYFDFTESTDELEQRIHDMQSSLFRTNAFSRNKLTEGALNRVNRAIDDMANSR